ncbi:MAG: septum site-determining protein MinC [Anaerolineaceae bacterium]|nr:MAG: septum site-determining protein MinC [Anaerolineaceae bacterium]
MDENPAAIQIKGIRDSLLVTLGSGTWPDLQSALVVSIDERPAFFRGARLALNVAGQVLHVAELSALRDVLSERGISLWAVLSESPVTEQTAQNLGLATRLSKPGRTEASPRALSRAVREAADEAPENAALWVQQTVRSGQKIVYAGNVVIVGEVNPGAEILAGGSVVVWGRLRGVVHAGAQGDEQAVVCALELSPTQLRIAGEIAVSPERKGKPRPEIARLKDGRLVAEPWQS